MSQTNAQSDPIVEILRLAYRRGLVIQREQEEKSKAVNMQPLDGDSLTAERKDSNTGKEYIHE